MFILVIRAADIFIHLISRLLGPQIKFIRLQLQVPLPLDNSTLHLHLLTSKPKITFDSLLLAIDELFRSNKGGKVAQS